MEGIMADEKIVLKGPDGTQIVASLSPDVMKTLYSNYISVSIAPEELYMCFFFLTADNVNTTLSRMVISLPHAKRLNQILSKLISEHENKFGIIPTEPKPK
jgi:hypothetical protein